MSVSIQPDTEIKFGSSFNQFFVGIAMSSSFYNSRSDLKWGASKVSYINNRNKKKLLTVRGDTGMSDVRNSNSYQMNPVYEDSSEVKGVYMISADNQFILRGSGFYSTEKQRSPQLYEQCIIDFTHRKIHKIHSEEIKNTLLNQLMYLFRNNY